jgi:hypothetical protein
MKDRHPVVPEDAVDPEEIVCRLCRRAFRAITWTHLRTAHGLPGGEEGIAHYKRKFRVRRVLCQDLRSEKVREWRRYYERAGRRWTRSRILREIRARQELGLPLNHKAVQKQAKALAYGALRNFGSWDAAVKASGLSPTEVRKARSWTRESLTKAIRGIKTEGGALNAKAVVRRDAGLHQAARRLFGSWDLALKACRIDPLSVRQSRVWSREEVLSEIRSAPPLRSGEAFLQNRKLWVAARMLFGSWDQAIKAAHRLRY